MVPLIRPPIVAPTALRLVPTNRLLLLIVPMVFLMRISPRPLPSESIRPTRPDLVPIRPLMTVLCINVSMESCLVPSIVVVSRVPRKLTK